MKHGEIRRKKKLSILSVAHCSGEELWEAAVDDLRESGREHGPRMILKFCNVGSLNTGRQITREMLGLKFAIPAEENVAYSCI